LAAFAKYIGSMLSFPPVVPMKLPLVLWCAMLPWWVHAEPVYRCGNTYSQTPCGADAAPKNLPSSAVPDTPAGLQGESLCASAGLSRLGLSDPGDAPPLGVTKLGSEVIQYADKPTVARKFAVRFNPRTAQGGHAGEQVFHCFLSEDGRRVLAIENAPQSVRP